jgi:hypothetical protein
VVDVEDYEPDNVLVTTDRELAITTKGQKNNRLIQVWENNELIEEDGCK